LTSGIVGLIGVGIFMLYNSGYLFWAAESLGLSSMVCYSPALLYARKIHIYDKKKKEKHNEKEVSLLHKKDTIV